MINSELSVKTELSVKNVLFITSSNTIFARNIENKEIEILSV